MASSSEALYRQREQRVLDAIALRKPDCVPVLPMFGFFIAQYAGMTVQEVMYDPDKLFEAQWKALIDFAPDMDNNPFRIRLLGPILDALDSKQMQWLGHSSPDKRPCRFVEGEYMGADEYDHFISDPLDFILRKYWPRVFGVVKGFEKLPPLHSFLSCQLGVPTGLAAFTLPEIEKSLASMKAVGEKSLQVLSYSKKYTDAAKLAGFPIQYGGVCQAPLDILGKIMRGRKGLLDDLGSRPEKVLKAVDKLLPITLASAVDSAGTSGNPRIMIPLQLGGDNILTEVQFQRFYWPTLRELIVALIDEGLTPFLVWEGDCRNRLPIIHDIPPARAVYAFETMDMKKAKQMLGETVCIRGNVPIELLTAGSPDGVKAYCKVLIDTCGRDGGFIMDAAAGIDNAHPANVSAMINFTREYSAQM